MKPYKDKNHWCASCGNLGWRHPKTGNCWECGEDDWERSEKVRGWIISDPVTNQMMKRLADRVVLLREERFINSITNQKKTFEAKINLDDYSEEEIVESLASFGYDKRLALGWVRNKQETALIAECLFQLKPTV
jgi:hypothetical protein